MSASIYLVKGREKSLLRRHPWIFSKGIERVQGNPIDGDTVEIYANDGKWLARGAWSGSSQIRARVWTFDKDETVDLDFFIRRLKYAQESRDPLIKRQGLTGYRLCAAESDGLPGLTIDRYADFLVCQILSAGAEFQRELITQALRTLYP
ncbi:MAG: 23S rRNA (cytosine(1962)-C(5))-methyltransferase RlmI, partial [Aeromonas veronii]